MTVDSQGQPTMFTWHGRVHHCRKVVQRREVDFDWWRVEGRIWRTYYALITDQALFCVVYYDHLGDAWRLVRLYD